MGGRCAPARPGKGFDDHSSEETMFCIAVSSVHIIRNA